MRDADVESATLAVSIGAARLTVATKDAASYRIDASARTYSPFEARLGGVIYAGLRRN